MLKFRFLWLKIYAQQRLKTYFLNCCTYVVLNAIK